MWYAELELTAEDAIKGMTIAEVLHDYYIALLCFGATLVLLTMLVLYRACSSHDESSASSSSTTRTHKHGSGALDRSYHSTRAYAAQNVTEMQPLVKRGGSPSEDSAMTRIQNVVEQV